MQLVEVNTDISVEQAVRCAHPDCAILHPLGGNSYLIFDENTMIRVGATEALKIDHIINWTRQRPVVICRTSSCLAPIFEAMLRTDPMIENILDDMLGSDRNAPRPPTVAGISTSHLEGIQARLDSGLAPDETEGHEKLG